MKIVDGTGRGFEAEVDDHGRLMTFSVTEAEDKHVNKHTGKVWSLPFTTTPVGPSDAFFYLKNTGAVNLFITDIRVDVAAAEVVTVNKVTGTPTFTSGGDITAISRNLGAALEPDATIKYDTNTTGLVDAGELFFLTCEANKLSHLRTSSNILVTPGSAIALYATTGAAAIKGMVSVVGIDE